MNRMLNQNHQKSGKKQNLALSDEVFIFNRKVYKPDFVPHAIAWFGDHLSSALHPIASRQAAYTILHELAPREVYRASSVALGAVSSYLTFSPLLQRGALETPNFKLEITKICYYQLLEFNQCSALKRFVFCCTVYLDIIPDKEPLLRPKDRRARCLLVSGLSSPYILHKAITRLSLLKIMVCLLRSVVVNLGTIN